MDIFLKEDVNKLLQDKEIVFMGDSNIRALYKDLLCLKKQTSYIKEKQLKKKMEPTAFGDQLLTNFPRINSRKYIEEREANIGGTKMSFYFLTRVYDTYVEKILKRVSSNRRIPDVFVINSCLWDITRWGPRGVDSYKSNIVKLMKQLKYRFPNCLVIWVTTPPVAQEMKGGFLVKELEFMKYSLRFHVMEANRFAWKVVRRYGFDILDSHYHLKMQIKRRAKDGIHWMPDAVRYVSNLLLAHISLAWAVLLPHRYIPRTEQNLIPDCIKEVGAGEHDLKVVNKSELSEASPHRTLGDKNVKEKIEICDLSLNLDNDFEKIKRNNHDKHQSRENTKVKRTKKEQCKEEINRRFDLKVKSMHNSYKSNDCCDYDLNSERTIIQSIVIVPESSTKKRKSNLEESVKTKRKNSEKEVNLKLNLLQ